MDAQLKDLSETIAEAYAVKFLADNVGGEIFLGGDIEQILADRAILCIKVLTILVILEQLFI
ncbi:hypothetical protein DWV63_06685 [Enterococcus durans]|nr:hypothetical protein DWV63_06685 [Enterococcus durans]